MKATSDNPLVKAINAVHDANQNRDITNVKNANAFIESLDEVIEQELATQLNACANLLNQIWKGSNS